MAVLSFTRQVGQKGQRLPGDEAYWGSWVVGGSQGLWTFKETHHGEWKDWAKSIIDRIFSAPTTPSPAHQQWPNHTSSFRRTPVLHLCSGTRKKKWWKEMNCHLVSPHYFSYGILNFPSCPCRSFALNGHHAIRSAALHRTLWPRHTLSNTQPLEPPCLYSASVCNGLAPS